MLSVLLMCFGSLMIAVTPTYTTIGLGAPPRCSGSRAMIQGPEPRRRVRHPAPPISPKVADEKHRGFYSSFQYVTPHRRSALRHRRAVVAAAGVFSATRSCAPGAGRIPFVIGAPAWRSPPLAMRRKPAREPTNFIRREEDIAPQDQLDPPR